MMKEFRIGDVFYKIDTPKIKAKANDFPTEYSEEYSIPLLTAGAENQGLNRWAKPSDCSMVINNVISVSANGANSGACFYQPCDFAVLQDAYAVKVHNHEIGSVEEGLYLTGALNKAVRDNHSWVNKAGWNRIKDDIVELPVIASPDPNHAYIPDDIDWQYMQDRIAELEQDRIAELEQDRIAELEAYLAATGLDDYELTDEDKAVLGDEKKMRKEFFLKELFGLPIRGTRLTRQKRISGDIPLVTAGAEKEGVAEFISNEEQRNFNDMITIDMFGNCFYRDYLYKADDNILSFGNGKNSKAMLYIVAAIRSVTEGYNYGKQYRLNSYVMTKISLPVIESADPNHTYTPDDIDWQYMEQYIRAMEKLAIADVVKYTDKVIATTKEIVAEQ